MLKGISVTYIYITSGQGKNKTLKIAEFSASFGPKLVQVQFHQKFKMQARWAIGGIFKLIRINLKRLYIMYFDFRSIYATFYLPIWPSGILSKFQLSLALSLRGIDQIYWHMHIYVFNIHRCFSPCQITHLFQTNKIVLPLNACMLAPFVLVIHNFSL